MICYSQVDSPVGLLILKSEGEVLTGIYMSGAYQDAPSQMPSDLHRWVLDPDAAPLRETARQLEEYFKGERHEFDLPLRLDGTEFQRRAWRNLLEIPYGKTRSYGEQAERIGNPKASRAVGLANGRNPIPIVVPCHRVIGANGSLTGFGGGIARKRWLLAHERRWLSDRIASPAAPLDHGQGDFECGAVAVRTIGGERAAVVKLRDQPHDVQAESEVRLVIASLTVLE
jgi:methylated-DNA-[protein]-cysteine S-methyltransferase